MSDRLLRWSKKDGFYTSFQATGGLSYYSSFNLSTIIDEKYLTPAAIHFSSTAKSGVWGWEIKNT